MVWQKRRYFLSIICRYGRRKRLSPNEYQKYENHIMLRHPREVHFDETVNNLNKTFCEQMSPFRIRYNCLQLTKEVNEYYTTYVSRVNSQAERFKLNVLSSGPAMDISGTCSVMGSNQFTPEAEYTISELSSSQQGEFL